MTLGVMKKGLEDEGCNYMVQWAAIVYIVVYSVYSGLIPAPWCQLSVSHAILQKIIVC